MAKEIIGLDISDYSIEAVLLHKKGKSFEVSSYSRFRLSPDIVEDGNILNKDKLQEAIQQTLFHAQPKQIQATKVFLSIPESKVFTKVISLPDDLIEKDIKEAAKNKAAEIIPEASENLVPAMKVLPASNGFRDVFYSTAQLGAIKDIVEVFKNLKMEIMGITTEAISSYVGLDDSLKDKTTLLLDIGNRTTIASIFDNNGIRDTINVNIAGENIVKSLVAKTGVAYNVAEEKMRDIGMVYSVEHGETMMIVQGQLQPLLDEIKVFVNYFEQSTDKKIEHLVLIGGLAQMKGIDTYFGENLSLSVVRGESFLGDRILPNQASSTKYINALGLARFAFEDIEINFLNEDFKKKIANKTEEKDLKPADNKIDDTEKKDESSSVKILEEEEEEDYDEIPKPFYKNKVTASILIILVLASVFIIFKNFILADIQKDKVTIAPGEQKIVEKLAVVPTQKTLSKNILVGLENVNANELFITTESYEKNRTIVYESNDYGPEQFKLISELGSGALVGLENPNVEQPGDDPETGEALPRILFTEEDDNIVSNIWDEKLRESELDILGLLNLNLLKEGHYILPSILDKTIETIKNSEEASDYKFMNIIVIRYRFDSIEENKVDELLKTGLSEEELADIDTYVLGDKKYEISGRKENGNFDLAVEYIYIK